MFQTCQIICYLVQIDVKGIVKGFVNVLIDYGKKKLLLLKSTLSSRLE